MCPASLLSAGLAVRSWRLALAGRVLSPSAARGDGLGPASGWAAHAQMPEVRRRDLSWFPVLPLAVDAEAGLDSCWVGSSQ